MKIIESIRKEQISDIRKIWYQNTEGKQRELNIILILPLIIRDSIRILPPQDFNLFPLGVIIKK